MRAQEEIFNVGTSGKIPVPLPVQELEQHSRQKGANCSKRG